jgi:hypothetical protein
MNVVAGMPRQPLAHLSAFVCAVVVHHQMHLQAARKITLDLIEKPQELLMPMSPVADVRMWPNWPLTTIRTLLSAPLTTPTLRRWRVRFGKARAVLPSRMKRIGSKRSGSREPTGTAIRALQFHRLPQRLRIWQPRFSRSSGSQRVEVAAVRTGSRGWSSKG